MLDGIDRSARYLTDEEDDGLEEDWDDDSNALVKDGDDLPLRPWTDTEEDWDKELDVACNNSGMASVSSGNISTKTNSPLQREERSHSVDIVGSFGNDEIWNTEDDSKSWKYNSKQGDCFSSF